MLRKLVHRLGDVVEVCPESTPTPTPISLHRKSRKVIIRSLHYSYQITLTIFSHFAVNRDLDNSTDHLPSQYKKTLLGR